jgi:hypothetical protein
VNVHPSDDITVPISIGAVPFHPGNEKEKRPYHKDPTISGLLVPLIVVAVSAFV